MAGPSNSDVALWARRLEDRSFKTYLSRIKAHQRLKRRANAWNASLIALSTSTTVASVGLLVNRNMYGRGGDALMLALAVLSLVSSLVVSSVSYGARAQAMESSYKKMQQISVMAESVMEGDLDPYRELQDIRREYLAAIESSENHSEADYARTANLDWWSLRRRTWKDSLVSIAPYVTLVIPVVLVLPFARWFLNGL